MRIVDAQVHIWPENADDLPWPAHRQAPFSADDLLREMDAAGVERTVIVPPPWAGSNNDAGLQAARQHPARLAVMGLLDLGAADARDQLVTWRSQPGMLGLRFIFALPHLQALPGDKRQAWLWAGAAAHSIPMMLNVFASQLPDVSRIAVRYPDLKLVIDHLAIPRGTKDAAAFACLDQLLVLARHANIAVKATSLPAYTNDRYPYRRLHPYLRRIVDAFGAKRVFWGTDFTKLPCPYRQCVTMFTEEMKWLSSIELEWIMGRGLCEWIGWPLIETR